MDIQTQLLLVVIVKALAELTFFFLLGQGVLWVLAGQKREQNGIYQIFKLMTSPVMKLTRLISPAVIEDRHIPWAATALVFWIWVASIFAKATLCGGGEIACQ